jgi:hypothetical protein
LAILAIQGGLGYVDFGLASASGSLRATFAYSGMCIGLTPSDDSGATSRALTSFATPVCFAYGAFPTAALNHSLPTGVNVLLAAAEQLSGIDSTSLEISAILAALMMSVVLLQSMRFCCLPGKEGFAAFMFLSISRLTPLVIIASMAGSLLSLHFLGQLEQTPNLWLTQPSALWAVYEARASGTSASSLLFDVNTQPDNWLAGFLFIPAIIGLIVHGVLEIVVTSRRKEGPPVWPCLPASCCGPDAESVGCGGEKLLSDAPLKEMCDTCTAQKRQTTLTKIDPSSLDMIRLMTICPLTLALFLATLSVPWDALNNKAIFTYTATGSVYLKNGYEVASEVEVVYNMSFSQGCVNTDDQQLIGLGYSARDCFKLSSPRQLALSINGNMTLPPSDFSNLVMTNVTRSAQAAHDNLFLTASFASVSMFLLLLITFCRARSGDAARFYRCWGKLFTLALVFSCLAALITAQTTWNVLDRLSSNSYLAALRGARIWSNDDYPVELGHITHPLAGQYLFQASSFTMETGDGWSDATATFGLSVAMFVVLAPSILCQFCGTFLGASARAELTHAQPLLETPPVSAAPASRPAPATRATPASRRAARASASASTASPTIPNPELVRTYGCLASITDAARRQEYENSAQKAAENIRVIRSAGLPSSVEASVIEPQLPIVQRRIAEILAADPPAPKPFSAKSFDAPEPYRPPEPVPAPAMTPTAPLSVTPAAPTPPASSISDAAFQL